MLSTFNPWISGVENRGRRRFGELFWEGTCLFRPFCADFCCSPVGRSFGMKLDLACHTSETGIQYVFGGDILAILERSRRNNIRHKIQIYQIIISNN